MVSGANEPAIHSRGFGVAGALQPDVVRRLANAAEAAGYHSFWVNDTPGGDGLAALREAASVTTTIQLGVGVIPVDRQPTERIATRVQDFALPTARLTLGIGAGSAPDGLARVRSAVLALKDRTGARITVGALGPKMCALAGEVADGVLLNWLTPQHVAHSVEVAERAATRSGRPRPRVEGYVRTALGEGAIMRLQEEGDRYASIPAYASHFARMGASPLATAVIGREAGEIRQGLVAFEATLDETIVRAITAEETADPYLTLLAAAAPEAEDGAASGRPG